MKKSFSIQFLLPILLILLILLVLLSLPTGFAAADLGPAPKAVQGAFDLRDWDHQSGQVVMLNGQWEFYWNRLLEYQDLHGTDNRSFPLKPDLYAEVPNLWNQYQIDGKSVPGRGFATYRLHVVTDFPVGTKLGIRPNTFSSASRIFINDKLIAETGNVSSKAYGEIASLVPKAVFFDSPAKEFDLIVQVSNFHYARGGFWYSMPFGLAEDILDLHAFLIGQELFLLGALFLFAALNVFLFLNQKELKYSLSFAGVCVAFAVNFDLVSGQTLLVLLFPDLPYRAQMYLWYASSDWILLLLLFYFHDLFRSSVSRIAVRIALLAVLPFEMLYVATEPVVFSATAYIGNILQGIALLCIIAIIAAGIRSGNRHGWLSLASLVLLGGSSILDGFQWIGLFRLGTGDLLPFGILSFILIHLFIQAARYRLYQNQKAAAELAFLRAQIKPHFLFNALNTFSAVSLTDNRKAQKLMADLSTYLRKSFDFKNIRDRVPLREELELLSAYLDIEQARFGDRVQIRYDVAADLNLEIPILLLQPIVENAINHGILPRSEGGHVQISIREEARHLVIQVQDDGCGMGGSMVQEILQEDRADGIGLYNINARLKRLYGTALHIESDLGQGTTVTVAIPIRKEVRN